jgi:hypothetical protein
MAIYRYGLLIPTGSDGADRDNAPLLGAATLGIEVTEDALARRCGLGNIDPQHDGLGSKLAAIEAAANWPLPPPGAMLVTIRPDLDSLGAMAVLTYRAEGRLLTPPMKTRIAEAAKADRFDRGPWPGPLPWPTTPEDLVNDLCGDDSGILSAATRNEKMALDSRVRLALDWLVSGIVPDTYRRAPLERAGRLLRAIREGNLLADTTEAPGRMVEVVTTVDGALAVGYRLAPVVVALNPWFAFPGGAIGPKYTVAQYAPGYADLDAALAVLLELEPGWGGSRTIKGSPQGHPSRLDRMTVARAVAGCLRELAA